MWRPMLMSDTVHPPAAPGPEGPAGHHAPGAEPEHAVRFEPRDVTAGPIVWFIVGLIVVTALIFAGIMGMMVLFNDRENKVKKSAWESAEAERKKDQDRQR